ncbi:MAG TPA: hypothetical protein VLS25_13230 [Dehalococcoidia bacterium]|nr:hypothetical protein [Dehalococcoidia bacterium]
MRAVLRPVLLVLAALVLMGASFVAVSLARSWWSSDGEGVDSPRAQEMSAFIGAAASKYSQGPDAFYDMISVFVQETCSRESFVRSVAGQPVPTTFKKLEDVSFDGDKAKAKILFVTTAGDKTIEWELVELGASWRIEHVPGMENCTTP